MSDLANNFQIVERPHGSCWLHKQKPMWIVHYPLARTPHYQAYRPANWVGEYDLNRRDPWALDNRRFSHEGYKTLEQAMNAVQNCEWEG